MKEKKKQVLLNFAVNIKIIPLESESESEVVSNSLQPHGL